jgi:hypothetical protein
MRSTLEQSGWRRPTALAALFANCEVAERDFTSADGGGGLAHMDERTGAVRRIKDVGAQGFQFTRILQARWTLAASYRSNSVQCFDGQESQIGVRTCDRSLATRLRRSGQSDTSTWRTSSEHRSVGTPAKGVRRPLGPDLRAPRPKLRGGRSFGAIRGQKGASTCKYLRVQAVAMHDPCSGVLDWLCWRLSLEQTAVSRELILAGSMQSRGDVGPNG